MEKLEKRNLPIQELRVITAGDSRKITGYAAVFNSLSEDLGGFREKIKPGAFRNALKSSDTRALWNHDANIVLGRSTAGTLTMKEDKRGLSIEIDPPKWADPYLESIERGDVSQMSFGFIVKSDQWEDKEGATIRTLIDIADLRDVSVVPFPAYQDTSVAIRSMEAWKGEHETEEKPEDLKDVINHINAKLDDLISKLEPRSEEVSEEEPEGQTPETRDEVTEEAVEEKPQPDWDIVLEKLETYRRRRNTLL